MKRLEAISPENDFLIKFFGVMLIACALFIFSIL